MTRAGRIAATLAYIALLACAGLTGCTYAAFKDVLSPVADENWSPNPTNFVVTYNGQGVTIEVYSMTVSGTVFMGPGVPIAPAGGIEPGHGLLIALSGTQGETPADLSKLRFFTSCANGACPVAFSLQRFSATSEPLPSGPFVIAPEHRIAFYLLPQAPIAKDQTYVLRFADAVKTPGRQVPDVQLRVKSVSEVGGL